MREYQQFSVTTLNQLLDAKKVDYERALRELPKQAVEKPGLNGDWCVEQLEKRKKAISAIEREIKRR